MNRRPIELWRLVYSGVTWLLLPFVLGYFYWRGRAEPAYRRHWRQRLGYDLDLPAHAIWVHAASVGEVELAVPLLAALGQAAPRRALLLTTMTPTGRDRALARLGERVAHCYLPLDTPGATRRFMAASRPRVAIFIETELWPNLIAAAAARDVPIALVNASISARSARRYARWPLAGAMRSMLSRVSAVAAASSEHAERFRALGAPSARIHHTGNLKYETGELKTPIAEGRRLRSRWQATQRRIWVAASTHAGEETLIIDTFGVLRQAYPDLLLVIAPRHPQRFDVVASQLHDSGWRVARRNLGQTVDHDTDIVLADTLGEVPAFYAAADAVFVGGSLVPGVGGHNVLEAAALERGVCVGPYMSQWHQIIEALRAADAARICDTPRELARALGFWLADPREARLAGVRAAKVVAAQRGALARSLAVIDTIMADPEGADPDKAFTQDKQ